MEGRHPLLLVSNRLGAVVLAYCIAIACGTQDHKMDILSAIPCSHNRGHYNNQLI